MKKNILCVKEPIITSFPSVAATFMALQSKIDDTNPWIMSHYIQLVSFNSYYRENWPMHIVNFIDAETANVDVLEDCDMLKVYKLPRPIVREMFCNSVEFIRYCMNMNFYIHCTFNQRYNPKSNNYNCNDFMHSAIIYGIDTEFIYLADFIDGKGFIFTKISYSDFEKGFVSVLPESDIIGQEYYNDIELFRVRDIKYELNINKIKRDINDYLYSVNSTNKYQNGVRIEENIKEYGIASYNNIVEVTCLKNDIDIRPFHVLFDHKKLMKKRVEYLTEHKIINKNTAELMNLADEVLTDTLKLRNYMIKKKMCGFSNMNIHDFSEKIWILKSKDIGFMKKLSNCI